MIQIWLMLKKYLKNQLNINNWLIDKQTNKVVYPKNWFLFVTWNFATTLTYLLVAVSSSIVLSLCSNKNCQQIANAIKWFVPADSVHRQNQVSLKLKTVAPFVEHCYKPILYIIYMCSYARLIWCCMSHELF